MFKVVEIEYSDTGLECRKTIFKSYSFGECIEFIKRGMNNISELIRDKFKKFFIFDKIDRMIPYVMVP